MTFHLDRQGNPNNFPILFLHGFMGNGRDFQDIILHLQEDFYCLAIDLPGHGQTEILGSDENYDMENTARAIANFLDSCQISQCYLMGYSMGGRLALYLALNFPQKFPKVILESASPGLKTKTERQERQEGDEKLARELEAQNFSDFLNNWYQNPLFSSLRKHPQFPIMLQRRLQNQPHLLAKSLRYLGTGVQPSLWEEWSFFPNPVLLLVGELDAKFSAIAGQMLATCPQAQLQIVKNCGHNIHLENPPEFIKKIKEFLNAS